MQITDTDILGRRQSKLAAGVLKQAAYDLRRFRGATTRCGQELYRDAFSWLTEDEFSWPFSFLNVCRTLNLVPETVREELISDLSLGTLDYWKRRCGRTARRFYFSLSYIFNRELTTEPNDSFFRNRASEIVI